jgi:hypothetical protein
LSEAIEEREKLVVGSIASGLSVGRYDGIENLTAEICEGQHRDGRPIE